MRIGDIMQKDVIKVPPKMTVVELDQVLMNHGISGAPVIGEGGVILGMVSKTDVIYHMSEAFASPDRPLERLTVQDIMTRQVVAVSPDDDVVEIARTMWERRIHRVLVHQAGDVIGICSTLDMLRAVIEFGRQLHGD